MKKAIFILALLLSSCATQESKVSNAVHQPTETEKHLKSGFNHLSNRSTKRAIAEFDKAITLCQGQYSNEKEKVYASRGLSETLYYMMKAAADEQSAIAVDSTCSDVLYYRGYATLDLGQIELAHDYVKRAVDMAPVNSKYLSELGHIIQTKRDWNSALEMFSRAEKAAETYSPPGLKDQELARAKRGIGYNLIELGKLDDAEAKYKECLDINENDIGAQKELNHINQLRKNDQTNS